MPYFIHRIKQLLQTWLYQFSFIGLAFFGLVLSLPLLASDIPQSTYSVTQEQPVPINTQMRYVEDSGHDLTVDNVLKSMNLLTWKPILNASPNFGFTDSAFWFRFDINNIEAANQDVLVELPIPFLDKVTLIRFTNEQIIEEHHVGDQRPFMERPIIHQNFVMPFTLEPGSNQFLVRVEAAGTIEVPFFVWATEAFLAADGKEKLLQGIWFGVLGIMVVYNLFLFGLLKDLSYLHYVCFAFSYMLFQGALKGYGFAYLWPEQLVWNSYAISVFIAASNLFAFLLVKSFLNLKQHSHLANRLFSLLVAISAVLLLASFIAPYNATIRINSAVAMVTCISALMVGYWSWHQGNSLAKYFCLAWTSALGGIAVLVAAKFGIVPTNFWTNNAAQIGVLAEVALLSFALASRFNREKEMRIRAQQSSLEHERLARQTQDALLAERAEANAKLEQKVAARTENLQRAMIELEGMNKKLEIISTTDSLTGLFNRRHFEACFADEFEKSCQEKRQLAVILCDIDHFKSINDKNGHQAGDECLQAVATTLKERIGRKDDLVARYGGEEFIVLLGNTSKSQAMKIAEDLRSALETLDFKFQGKRIPVTASFGVSALDSDKIPTADQLVTQADVALYEAKDSGRNKVMLWKADAPDTENIPSLISGHN